jgi:hypothetical protein
MLHDRKKAMALAVALTTGFFLRSYRHNAKHFLRRARLQPDPEPRRVNPIGVRWRF